jgi:hypothetical protein
MRNKLDQIGIGNNFMNGTPKAQQLREYIDKWDCMKLKSFCSDCRDSLQNEENLCQLYL